MHMYKRNIYATVYKCVENLYYCCVVMSFLIYTKILKSIQFIFFCLFWKFSLMNTLQYIQMIHVCIAIVTIVWSWLCVAVQDGGMAAVNQTVNKEAARAKVRKQVGTKHFSLSLCVSVCMCVVVVVVCVCVEGGGLNLCLYVHKHMCMCTGCGGVCGWVCVTVSLQVCVSVCVCIYNIHVHVQVCLHVGL